MSDKSLAASLMDKFAGDREKMERYSAVAEFCPIPAFVTAHDGTSIVYVNPAYREFTGRSLEEVQNYDWLAIIHPLDRERVEAEWKSFTLTDKHVSSVRRYLRKDGMVVEGVMTAYRVEMNGYVGFILPACNHECNVLKMASSTGISPAA